MVEVIFNYEGISTSIQCNSDDTMKDIIDKYMIKMEITGNNLYYLYNGIKINENIKFNEQANDVDKNRMKMNIIVYKEEETDTGIIKIKSKDIVCPICKESCFFNFDDFKISLHGCKYNHKKNNMILNKYENTQLIDISVIICNVCKKNNRGNTYNNEFYICNTCNKNVCPLCKSIHDKNHILINYDDKNYICKKHNETFTKYCKKCKEDICKICENKHYEHDTVDLGEILIDKEELLKINEDLKNVIDRFKYIINNIKQIFDNMIDILNIYYKISNDNITNYNINKRYYHKLKNLYNIKINDGILINDLNHIVNNDNISTLYEYSIDNFYNKNGERYIGKYKNGLKDGKGILYYNKDDINQKVKYEGDFKEDIIEGKGVIYWNDGERYEGDFKNGMKDGKGIYYYKNGEKYIGDFKKELKEGNGIYYYINGDRFEGQFKKGVIDGKGIMYYKNGKRKEGYWKNDKLIQID